jgi:hypothetical protein
MKTFKKGVCLFLILTAQVFAQRFTASAPDIVETGYSYSNGPVSSDTGYSSHSKQIAALGEKKSSYSNIMLLGGRDTALVKGQEKVSAYNVVNSKGNVFGTVYPFSKQNIFTTAKNDTVHDNRVSAVAVLDSLNDNKKTAIVLFGSLRNLVIMEITVNNITGISSRILKTIDMPEQMWQADNAYNTAGSARRIALLGTALNGTDRIYNLATGNSFSKSGANKKSGRVDFFSIIENSWTFWQQNTTGLAHGINGLSLGENIQFGTDLAVLGNLDKKGGKSLAVLLPASTQHPQSAVYIFSMDNDWTPSSNIPNIITGTSKPWYEYTNETQNCTGLGVANWGEENSHLLVSCNIYQEFDHPVSSRSVAIKDIVLDSSAKILYANNFFYKYGGNSGYLTYYTNSNPLPIDKHKNDFAAVALAVDGPHSLYTLKGSFYAISVMDADYSKNYSIEAGRLGTIANIDSIFYKSGTDGFSAKTFFGATQCSIDSNKELLCLGEENAIGSWSGIELSSASNCNQYIPCKRKDSIFVYVRSPSESPNTALRIPKNIVVPFFSQININSLKSLAYFRNPNLQNTGISWNASGLELCAAMNNNSNGLSIIPFSNKEGTDTLIFNLSMPAATNHYPINLHIADTSKILENGISKTPGNDTVWNTAQKKFIALPLYNSTGNAYTYDIVQKGLGAYTEIIGNYLHISKVDVSEISVAYTENAQIKARKIILMPEAKPAVPSSATIAPFAMNLNAIYINGNVQITNFSGELELRAYNFNGKEIQKEKVYSKGFASVKLERNCPQIVQIKGGNKIIYLKIVN